jgi:hypothetical protein
VAEVDRTVATRSALHRVAAHILGRRRFVVSGRFGLRAGPAGIVTPSFGDDPETIRIAGTTLVREVSGLGTRLSINGSTLAQLAAFVDVDLDEPFDSGPDTPPVGPVDVPFDLAVDPLTQITDWLALAWHVLDEVAAAQPGQAEVATIQLWPEHFDAATTVTLPSAQPVNLGFSPGDGYESEPYVYVGPSSPARPGAPGFWNAPFGAARRFSDVQASPDPAETCRRFLAEGLARVTVP